MFIAMNTSAESNSEALLKALSQELRTVRSLPQGTSTRARCPENGSVLVGVQKQALVAALGDPDFISPQNSNQPFLVATWTYFFTSPLRSDQRGGGFPELSFVFGPEGRVTSVSCHYSR